MKQIKEKTDKYISTVDARKIITASWRGEISHQTLYDWMKKYKLGFKFAGRWHVDKNKLKNFLKMKEIS